MEIGKGIVEWWLGRKKDAKSKETAKCYYEHRTSRNESSSSKGEGEMCFPFGEDLLFKALWDGDFLESGTGGILKNAVLLEPVVQFGIDFGKRHGLGEVWIIAVHCRAIEQQNLFGFLAIHAAPCGFCSVRRTQAFFGVERCREQFGTLRCPSGRRECRRFLCRSIPGDRTERQVPGRLHRPGTEPERRGANQV